jgi:hypothetical protein
VTGARERAIDALARHITEAKGADADPRAQAAAALLELEALGYRPTEARPAADWRHKGTGSASAEVKRAAVETLKEACATATAGLRKNDTPQDGAA